MATTSHEMNPPDALENRVRVLVVDDDEDYAEAQAEFLTSAGYEAQIALNCNEALQRDQHFGPDIALIDLRLGDENGLDALGFLLAQSPALSCIIITGHGGLDRAVEAMRGGAMDYLSKPIDPQELLLVLERVHERKVLIAAKEAAEALSKELEARVKAKSDLLSRASHEFRTPMNAILGHGQLLQMDRSQLTEMNRQSVDSIVDSGNHLLSLIDSMLDLSKSETHELLMEVSAVALKDVIGGCILIIEEIATEEGVTLPEVPETSVCVLADYQRLSQLLLNVLSNAVKYNKRGGTVTVRVVESSPELVRIEIEDTGLGMDQSELDKVFDPFYRLPSSFTTADGTGLGLTISKSLAEQMDGRIGAESTPGKGSTFWIELPRAEEPEKAE